MPCKLLFHGVRNDFRVMTGRGDLFWNHLFHNFRTDLVGSNQIKTVFDPEYERYINLDGYNRISQYYLRPEDFSSDDDSNDNDIY